MRTRTFEVETSFDCAGREGVAQGVEERAFRWADAGAVGVDVPRDRNGEYAPQVVPKGKRRIAGFNDMVISLLSRGMTTRDIQAHIRELYKVEISPELVSKVTDAALPELRAWQNRPLDPI